jgi:hypothetical protein
MTPTFAPAGLAKARPWEWVVRFVFGGVVTAATGMIAHRFGPVVGGLFLAFPAILPASLTLVQQHDGRRAAADDARGACLGSIALAAFAVVTWQAPAAWPGAVILVVATVVWIAVAVAAWFARYGLRRRPSARTLRARHAHRAGVA